MHKKYHAMAYASGICSAIAGYLVGKAVYKTTGNDILAVASGVLVWQSSNTVAGQKIGQKAAEETIAEMEKEDYEEV